MKNIYVITTGFFIPKKIVANLEATLNQAKTLFLKYQTTYYL